jgi:hypothetical protein
VDDQFSVFARNSSSNLTDTRHLNEIFIDTPHGVVIASQSGRRLPLIKGGTEAARTVLSVLRQMISWGIDEEKLKRTDNPASNMEKNLPKKKKGERCLSLRERREAWRAAGDLARKHD